MSVVAEIERHRVECVTEHARQCDERHLGIVGQRHAMSGAEALDALLRTTRWARRCLDGKKRVDPALFGIVQGSTFSDLRRQSAESLTSLELDGYAIGGLSVGDTAIAVGHPFGIPYSLSQGVISGLHRDFKSKDSTVTITNTIQFDAAVNPGNSGGPLLDEHGEVVGIVTGLLNPSDQNLFIGIGFAVPIETAGGGGGSPPW